MKLRIVSGMLKGRTLMVSDRGTPFRPTLGRVRESVADMLMVTTPDALVADVCAGSGAMGFELLSRGARQVFFVEHDRSRSLQISRYAEQFQVKEQCRVITEDAVRFVRSCQYRFDLIYYDPPYDTIDLALLVPQLRLLLTDSGALVYERRCGKNQQELPFTAEPFKKRLFGETEISLFNKSGTA